MGNPKTQSPGPWITTMYRVYRRPYEGPRNTSTDPLYGPPPKQNKNNKINEDFTYGLSDGLLMLVKFGMLHCPNVTDLGSSSGASCIITHIAITFAVAIHERLGSLQEVSKFVLLPLRQLVQPILPWVCELVPGFAICSAEVHVVKQANNLKTHLHNHIEPRM